MKKLISILLTFCMLMVFIPTAYAASTPPDFSDGWTALTSADGGKTFGGGNYYLNDDITIEEKITFTGTAVLDLNGHVIKLNSKIYGGTASSCVIYLHNRDMKGKYHTINFTLQDSNPTAKHYFSKQANGLWKWEPTITEAAEGYELVKGGVITGGDSPNYGGGIYIYSENDSVVSIAVNINGGSIVGCRTGDAGGGIYNTQGTVTMNGGNIIGCISGNYGGGITSIGNFTINSGSIKDCTAANGAGVSFGGFERTFTMNGGKIENCVATSVSGGILNDGATFKMKGGSIKNCTAKQKPISDAYFSLNGSKLYADGGVIDGAVYTAANCEITRSADAGGTTVFNEKVTYACNISAGIFYGGLEKNGKGSIVGNTYTVKFYENSTDTEPFATALVVGDGTKLVPPTMPEREGYTLVWYTENGSEYDFNSVVDSDFSLYARFVPVDSGDTDSDLPVWLDILLSILKLVFKILVDKGVF